MNKKILVIEDDPTTLRLTKYTLEHEGYQVLTASNGLEGLKKARSEKPDLIMLDVMLPGIDGFEICHRLRAEPQTAQLPVLMLSAKARETDKATGLKVGADDYIIKPWHRPELLTKVATLSEKSARSRNVAKGEVAPMKNLVIKDNPVS
jgi:two-component system alkaline phosphatase synthesis response regulator PhoP